MLENQFYATQPSTIHQMLKPYMGRGRWHPWQQEYCRLTPKPPYLEPHGGSGAILDHMVKKVKVDPQDLYTCEIDPDLRFLLQGKGYRVVASDFLTYDEPVRFGLIVMNPPFADGVKHILHAWGLLADGGHLVALLNVETLKKPISKERENLISLLASMIGEVYHPDLPISEGLIPLLAELEAEGAITFMDQCFRDGDRPTTVEVVMIRLHKPEKAATTEFGDKVFDLDADRIESAFATNQLALKSPIKDLVARYNAAVRQVTIRYDAQRALDFYLKGIAEPVYNADDSSDVRTNLFLQKQKLEDQLATLKSRFWNTVFTRTDLGNRTPSGFRKKFYEYCHQQKNMAFTEHNVWEVLDLFFMNQGKMMQDCVVEVFDQATKYHEKNTCHREGWKTNKSWKIKKGIILPNGIHCSESTYGGVRTKDFTVMRSTEEFLNDFDKILCWLSGTSMEIGVQSWRSLHDFCWSGYKKNGHTVPFESHFFIMRIYLKGTLHITFKDLELLDKFNHVAAQGKKWIGGGY